MEKWRTVNWGDGKYQVSDKGQMRNTKTGKILKQTFYKNYFQIVLQSHGTCKCFRVHRLVAEAFVPNPNNLPCVNHKDENTKNNSADNLEWCDVAYNNSYGTKNERTSKTQINTKRLSKEIVQYDLEMKPIHVWPSAAEVQRQLGIYATHVNEVCRGNVKTNNQGRKWVPKTAGGYIWKRKEAF